MKKLVYALAALSMVALMGLTSCSKSEPQSTNPYSEILAMNKYIGMKMSDVKTALEGNGWTEITVAPQFNKTINGNTVKIVLSDDEEPTPMCLEISVCIPDGKYLENAKAMIIDVTDTYKFENVGSTTTFTIFTGKPSDGSDDDITNSYTEAKDWLNTRTYKDFNGTWTATSATDYHALMIQTVSQLQQIMVAMGNTY